MKNREELAKLYAKKCEDLFRKDMSIQQYKQHMISAYLSGYDKLDVTGEIPPKVIDTTKYNIGDKYIFSLPHPFSPEHADLDTSNIQLDENMSDGWNVVGYASHFGYEGLDTRVMLEIYKDREICDYVYNDWKLCGSDIKYERIFSDKFVEADIIDPEGEKYRTYLIYAPHGEYLRWEQLINKIFHEFALIAKRNHTIHEVIVEEFLKILKADRMVKKNQWSYTRVQNKQKLIEMFDFAWHHFERMKSFYAQHNLEIPKDLPKKLLEAKSLLK